MDAERSMLFSLIAVREGKLDAERLSEISEDLPKLDADDLGDHLQDTGLMSKEDCDTISSLVDVELSKHGGDMDATLMSLASADEIATVMSEHGALDTLATVLSKEAPPGVDPGTQPTMLSDPMGPAFRTDEVVPAVEEHKGRYEERREFAAGGMGRILLVHDNHLSRDVALKQLLPSRLPGGTFERSATGAPTASMLTVPIIARFLQEARVTGQLEHPSIVPVYELGYRADGSLYYTMRLVRGRTMQDVIKEAGGIRGRLQLLPHFLDLCQAMAYAHSRGVIHRDLKPLNVMIGEFGETVVIDWGIAKVRGMQDIHAKDMAEAVRTLHVGSAEQTAKTTFGQTMGSPYFMPPEQARGDTNKIDERSDVYALGAVLYTILTGQPPYSGMKAMEFLEKVQAFPPKPAKELAPDVPAELAAVCERAMARDPEGRYPTAVELAHEIQEYIAGGLVSAYDYNVAELVKRFVRKHAKVLSTAAAGLVALIALGVFSYVQVVEQRNIALANEAEAKRQEGIAKENEAEALLQKSLAEEARDEAEIARRNAERELYFSNVALAQDYYEERQMALSKEKLAQAPSALRGWEWGHLLALNNQDAMTLDSGGREARFCPGDGILTAKANGTVTVLGRGDGQVRHTLVEKAGLGFALAASADGGRVAVSGSGAMGVWDTQSGERLFAYTESGRGLQRNHVALSGNGEFVAALNTDRTARVWRVGGEAPLFALDVKQQQGFGLYFTQDGTRLLVTRMHFDVEGWQRIFELCAVPSGEVLNQGLLRDPLSAHSAAFSADGAWFALGTDAEVQLWRTGAWEQAAAHTMRFNHPDTVAFQPGGPWLAGGGMDGDVALWNTETGEEVRVPDAHGDTVRAVAFSPGGARLATASFDRTMKLWSVPDLRLLHTFSGHNRSLLSLDFSGDGAWIATGSFDGATKIWDARQDLHFAPVRMADMNALGVVAGALGGQVGVWDAQTGHRRALLGEPGGGAVEELRLCPGGERLALLRGDMLELWQTAPPKQLAALEGFGGRSRQLAVGGDSHAGVRTEAGVTVVAIADGEVLLREPAGMRVAFSPSGTHVLVTVPAGEEERDREVRVHALPSGEVAARATYPTDILTAAFAPGSAYVAVGLQLRGAGESYSELHRLVLDGAAPAPMRVDDLIQTLTFSADGKLLAAGLRTGAPLIWETEGWEPVFEVEEGHSSYISAMAFTPMTERLITASQDGTVKLWHVAEQRDVLTVFDAASHDEVRPFTGLDFSADGLRLLVGNKGALAMLPAFPWKEADYGAPRDRTGLMEAAEQYKRAQAPDGPL